MRFSVLVEVKLRPGIADPQGTTIERSLPHLGFDGIAGVEVPNGSKTRPLNMPGPHFINAGSSFYNLDVVSLSFAQHF